MMSDIGPITKMLLLVVLVVACVIIFLTPYIGVYYAWDDFKKDASDSASVMVLFLFGLWALVQTAVALDWIYWGILWLIG